MIIIKNYCIINTNPNWLNINERKYHFQNNLKFKMNKTHTLSLNSKQDNGDRVVTIKNIGYNKE